MSEYIVEIIILQKLLDMNNFHSSKAILSGLQSEPVYRLEQTWMVCFEIYIYPFAQTYKEVGIDLR